MSINTFHGNFFVRSTDLLSLPNVNPDHSFSMQIDIEDNLTESSMVAFQAALLYTTTKGTPVWSCFYCLCLSIDGVVIDPP